MDMLDWALWTAVVAALAYVADVYVGGKATERETRKRDTCPHGYEDWDYCPVCCH